jgi:hypothetical protein
MQHTGGLIGRGFGLVQACVSGEFPRLFELSAHRREERKRKMVPASIALVCR